MSTTRISRENERLAFRDVLAKILGTSNLYFQSPGNTQMKYPAIIYSLDRIDSFKADNNIYRLKYVYKVVYVDKDPTSDVVDKLASIPSATFNQFYVTDNLNHYVFTINYIGGLTYE